MEYQTLILTLACIFGFLMAYGIGANDVANAMGTSVGSKTLTLKQAIVIAAVFECCGAILAGSEVTGTISHGITDMSVYIRYPNILIYGMLAALLASAVWLIFASYFGLPVSTTHTIIGAIVGFAVYNNGVDAVNWLKIGSIVLSWIISPLIGGIVAFAIFKSLQKFILQTSKPFDNAKKYVPFYVLIVGFIIGMVTLVKGLKHIDIALNDFQNILVSLLLGLFLMLLSKIMLRNVKRVKEDDIKFHYTNVEKIFGVMMIFTACSMAFAHGSNDVANAVGPLAAISNILSGDITSNNVPSWVLILGGIGIVIGLSTYGYKVIYTIGQNITELTPSRGFAAELSAASTVVISSGFGMPVSTTHVLVGAILGVGFARGIGALNRNVINKIFMSWAITLPAGAILSIIFFISIKHFLS
tara:strand:+ start:29142 stop:30386 length:1245 start_codon:yes stop_codon:yes gene_type:complete